MVTLFLVEEVLDGEDVLWGVKVGPNGSIVETEEADDADETDDCSRGARARVERSNDDRDRRCFDAWT